MQAFSDLGQRQEALTQADTSLSRVNPPEAIAAFVLALIGLLLFPAAVVALVYANRARAKVRDQPMRYSSGLATTASVIAWLGLAIAVTRFVVLAGN